jgi:hypothetical protein
MASAMQAKFSAFMKRPKKKARTSRAPFGLRSFDSDVSQHPYASPEVFDINSDNNPDTQSTSSYHRHPPSRASNSHDFTDGSDPSFSRATSRDSDAPAAAETERQPSPQPQLEVSFSREPLQNLLPSSYFLNPDADNRSESADDLATPQDGNTVTIHRLPQPGRDDDGDGDGEDSSEDDVADPLKPLNVRHFHSVEASVPRLNPCACQASKLAVKAANKRHAPAPISIPTLGAHAPKVQLVRSGQQSRPISATSIDEASSVSGTTLARALLANTFVLSNDNRRASRYRSDVSVLTRSDSATLPRGDHPLLNSPYGTERVLSAASDGFGARPFAKPVPPVPENAEQVYVPPTHQRDTGRPLHAKQMSHDSQASSAGSAIIVSPTSLMHSLDSPESDPPKTATPDDVSQGDVPLSAAEPSPAESTSLAYLASESDVPTSSASDQQSPGQLMGDVLEYYNMPGSAPPGEFGYKPAFSPIVEETGSQLSPPTPMSNRGRVPLSATPSSSSLGSKAICLIKYQPRY